MKPLKLTGLFCIIYLVVGIIFPIGFSSAQAGTTLTIITASLPSATVGTVYSTSISASGGSGSYSWSLASGTLPPGLSLFQGVCIAIVGPCQAPVEISGTPITAGTYIFTVQVISEKETASKQFSITVTKITAPLTITTTSLPSGAVDTSYSASILASGGSDSYVWSIVFGSLPTGLTLHQPVCFTSPCQVPAEISGTPNVAGTYTFTIQMVSGKEIASKQFTIIISSTVKPLAIITASLPSATVGIPYSASISASGGSDSYSWSLASGTLPPGLSLFHGVCIAIVGPCQAPVEISGTPTAAGNYTFTILVSDGTSKASKKFTVAVVSPPSQVKYFRYVMTDNVNEWFIVKMTNPATIQQALDDLKGARRLIVNGIVSSGNGGFNSPWSWHLDPTTIVLGENFIELCDASLSYIETHLAEWLGQRFCPWDARVNAVYDTPPTLTQSLPSAPAIQVQVNVNALNVRQDGALSAAKIGLVRQGEMLTKLEEKSGWVKVQLSNNQIGWVFGQYVAPTTAPAVSTLRQKVIVTAWVLNVRVGPGVNNKIITTVQRNNVLEKVEKKGEWVKVILTNGQSGWVYGEFVR